VHLGKIGIELKNKGIRIKNVVFLIFILTHPSLAELALPLSTLVERGEAAVRWLGVSEI